MRPTTIPHAPYVPTVPTDRASTEFLAAMRQRRSVREFSPRPVARGVIESVIAAAATAPSGANKQPWRFVAVSDAGVKKRIRDAAEREEREFYERRASPEWLQDLAPIGTDPSKPFLDAAPWLIAVFKLMRTDPTPDKPEGGQVYYANESVGIACGMLITAIHLAGLVTLTHTPSPMGFLTSVLGRPAHERPFLLLPVGYPAEGARVPDIRRKPLSEVAVWLEERNAL
jgi:nitroreductase